MSKSSSNFNEIHEFDCDSEPTRRIKFLNIVTHTQKSKTYWQNNI